MFSSGYPVEGGNIAIFRDFLPSIISLAARKWEATKKTEWSTPKRQRISADFPHAHLEPTSTSDAKIRAILSPASSMGGVEEEEEEEEEPQPLPEDDAYDRPDTPPLSQRADESKRMVDESHPEPVGSARRNLFTAFKDSPSP